MALPNNLVFVLGAFAFHLQVPPSLPPTNVAQFVQAQVERDASAFLEGWNDVVEAAAHDNGNKPLTVPQFSSMMLNLRYRAVFIGKETHRAPRAERPQRRGGRRRPEDAQAPRLWRAAAVAALTRG